MAALVAWDPSQLRHADRPRWLEGHLHRAETPLFTDLPPVVIISFVTKTRNGRRVRRASPWTTLALPPALFAGWQPKILYVRGRIACKTVASPVGG